MDWLKGMNDVILHIEDNLQQTIAPESLSRIVGCSVYEFYRIFSFMTGISVSEYIRRRRLSQAVFDIQYKKDRIIDIALKYCYESPTSFAKAFKELHGVTPSAVRKASVTLKTYPPITFKLMIKGANEMNFRIEKKDSFAIVGQTQYATIEDMQNFCLPSIYSARQELPEGVDWGDLEQPGEYEYNMPDGKVAVTVESNGAATVTRSVNDGKIFKTMIDTTETAGSATMSLIVDGKNMEEQMEMQYVVVAFDFSTQDLDIKFTVGGEIGAAADLGIDPDMCREIPAADWVVFAFTDSLTPEATSESYTRILTEWFPTSGYKRNEAVPHMERFPIGPGAKEHPWEIWIPITKQ